MSVNARKNKHLYNMKRMLVYNKLQQAMRKQKSSKINDLKGILSYHRAIIFFFVLKTYSWIYPVFKTKLFVGKFLLVIYLFSY